MVLIKRKGERRMAYTSDYELTKVYKNNYRARYMEEYRAYFNEMKQLYTDEQALASAVATAMIAFCKASGMDTPGVITWDETQAVSDEDFKTFVELKNKPVVSSPPTQVAPQNRGNVQQQQVPQDNKSGRNEYVGPTTGLKGRASEAQVNKINEYLNDQKNPEVSDLVTKMLLEANVSSAEELSKQEAFDIIGAVSQVKRKAGFVKKSY